MAAAEAKSEEQPGGGAPGEKPVRHDLQAIDWPLLVQQIKAGNDAGMEQLYKLSSRGIRYHCR